MAMTFDERLLALNDALQPLQQQEYVDRPLSNPCVFVVGAPRTGTTLAMQLIASGMDVGYINNLIAAFWKAPAYGIALSDALLHERLRTDFRSRYGRTRGILEPHEFGRFWIDLLAPFGLEEPEDVEAVDWTRLRRAVAAVSAGFGRPAVFKASMLGWYAVRATEALGRVGFVRIRRDHVDTALSLIGYRRALHGSDGAWVSLKPKGWEKLVALPVPQQVAAQAIWLERSMDRQLAQLDPGRVVDLEYSELCSAPDRFIDRVQGLFSFLGAEVPRTGEVPTEFEESGRGEKADERAAVVAAVRDLLNA